MDRYLLRNVTKNDVSLGDLGYKIPAGQTRDLLSKTARLDRKRLEKSIISGSIEKRLRQGVLVEVVKYPNLNPPKKIDVSQMPVAFPRNRKSSIVLDVAELDEQMSNIILDEEDDLLRELQGADAMGELGEAPLVARSGDNNDEEGETETEDSV